MALPSISFEKWPLTLLYLLQTYNCWIKCLLWPNIFRIGHFYAVNVFSGMASMQFFWVQTLRFHVAPDLLYL